MCICVYMCVLGEGEFFFLYNRITIENDSPLIN